MKQTYISLNQELIEFAYDHDGYNVDIGENNRVIEATIHDEILILLTSN